MKKNIYHIVILALFITSCTHSPEKALNKVINKSSAESDIALIEKNSEGMDSIKIRTLNNLMHLSKGYEAYQNDLKSKNSILLKYLVNQDTFEKVNDSIFNYFDNNNITYRKLLGEIEAINRINAKYAKIATPSADKLKGYEIKFASKNWSAFNTYTMRMFIITQ